MNLTDFDQRLAGVESAPNETERKIIDYLREQSKVPGLTDDESYLIRALADCIEDGHYIDDPSTKQAPNKST